MTYVHQAWPAMLYRVTEAGDLEGKAFDNAESVTDGFERHNPEMDARAAALKAKAPKPAASEAEPKGDAAKVKSLEGALKASRDGEKKAGVRISELEELLDAANKAGADLVTENDALAKKVKGLEASLAKAKSAAKA